MKKTLYRTVVRFEILSEEKLDGVMSLTEIDDFTRDGGGSGRFLSHEVENEELVGEAAVEATKAQGSDPEFFNMDQEGNDNDMLRDDVAYRIVENLDDHVGYNGEMVRIIDVETTLCPIYTVKGIESGIEWSCGEEELEATDYKWSEL